MTTHPFYNPKHLADDIEFYDDFDDGAGEGEEDQGDASPYATIPARFARRCYEICPLCDWAAADYAVDGPDIDLQRPNDRNLGYSLREARLNFESGRCIFTPRDGGYYTYQTDEETLFLKEQLCALFDAMPEEARQGRLYLLWGEAQSLRNRLIAHLQSRLTQARPETFLPPQSRADGSGKGWMAG